MSYRPLCLRLADSVALRFSLSLFLSYFPSRLLDPIRISSLPFVLVVPLVAQHQHPASQPMAAFTPPLPLRLGLRPSAFGPSFPPNLLAPTRRSVVVDRTLDRSVPTPPPTLPGVVVAVVSLPISAAEPQIDISQPNFAKVSVPPVISSLSPPSQTHPTPFLFPSPPSPLPTTVAPACLPACLVAC